MVALDPPVRTAVARLAAAVLSVEPLVAALTAPVRVVPVSADGTGQAAVAADWRWYAVDRLLTRVAEQTGVPGLTLAPTLGPDDVGVFERVVSSRLALADLTAIPAVPDGPHPGVERAVAEAMADSFDVAFGRETIRAPDGIPLRVFAAGSGDDAIVVVPACGMPGALAESWLRFVARDRRVLAWESRGLFGADDRDDYAVDTATQVGDLFAVMDHYGVSRAHVIGLCGGAVIGLAAAACLPARVRSLSLWHGAYAFSGGSPRTRFQNDLIELMTVAGRSRSAAASVQAVLCRMALTTTSSELAHLVLYPYTNSEIFYRYCRLNGALARTDVGQYLARVDQPALVVTSEDDQTAHPRGSWQVAEGLSNGRLHVEPYGDHSTLFRSGNPLMQLAVRFIERAEAAPRVDRPRFRRYDSRVSRS